MNDSLIFSIAMFMNIIGAGLLLSTLITLLLQSARSRGNRLLAAYLAMSAIWGVCALATRIVMTSTIIGDQSTSAAVSLQLISVMILALCGNSPFLLGFAIDYANLWGNPFWKRLLLVAAAVNIACCLFFIVRPHTVISNYGITQIGMIHVDVEPLGFALLAVCFYFWYGIALRILYKYAWPQAKPIIVGICLTASALLIESMTNIGDWLPVSTLFAGVAAICYVYAVIRDQKLNPLRQSNAQLQRSQDNLESILSAIPASAIVTDESGKRLWCNSQTDAVLQTVAGTPTLANLSDLFAYDDERNEILTAYAQNGALNDVEFRFKTAHGAVRWGRLNMSHLRYNGQSASLNILEDIHDQKLAEESLRQSQKWETMAVLAGGVAHDFNNLLVAILGQASILDYHLRDEPKLHKHVSSLTSAARRSAELTKQMLAYSGKGQFITRKVDLNEVVRENIGLIYASTSHAVDISTNLVEPLPAIMADPTQMQQIVMNLAINAAQALGTQPNSKISFQSDVYWADDIGFTDGDWHTRIGEFEDCAYVALNVTDNGMGMNAETLNQIFNPFFTTKKNGSGLGLAAVQGIIRAHHGVMRVRSEPGVGTTFQLLIPAVVERQAVLR